MDSELFEVLVLPDGEELVPTRPDYRTELLSTNSLKVVNCPSSAVAVQPLRRVDKLIIEHRRCV